MNIRRVKAIVLQEYFITLRSLEVIMDHFFFPLVNIVVFGFLSLYLGGGKHSIAGQNVLLGMLLWQIIWITQYSISLGSLWNIWSRNMSNIFIAPILTQEYVFAHTISGVLKAIIILIIGSVISYFVFHFNILTIGIIPLILIFINFTFFAFSSGIAILGLIVRFGTRIQALAWGLIPMIQPLTAAFFPVSVLPQPMQYIAYVFPPTLTFEGARYSLSHHVIYWKLFEISFGENIICCMLCLLFFQYMFRKSRDLGQFARNEG